MIKYIIFYYDKIYRRDILQVSLGYPYDTFWTYLPCGEVEQKVTAK